MLECDQDVNSNEGFFLFSSRSIGQQATAIGLTIGQRCSSVTKLVTVMSVALIPMHAQKSLKMFKNTDNIGNKIFTSCNKTSAVKTIRALPRNFVSSEPSAACSGAMTGSPSLWSTHR